MQDSEVIIGKINRYWQDLPMPWRLGSIIFLFLCLVIISFFSQPAASIPERNSQPEYFQLRKGPLVISLIETGEIKSREKNILQCEVEGTTNILWLIKEGTVVNKGDLLIELDGSKIQSKIIDQGITINNAQAAYIIAREKVDVIKNQGESDVYQAKLKFRFAKEDLNKYMEGDYPKALKELTANITLKKEELRRAQEKLEWSKKLFKKNYLSKIELDGDELAASTAGFEADLAERSLIVLKDFSYQRTVAELEGQVHQTEMALERIKRKSVADNIQAEADLKAKESQFSQEKIKLDKMKEQLAKTRITSPTDGLVIYATSAGNWMNDQAPLAVGMEVHERQELMYLPKSSSMITEIKIPEAELSKISVGNEARLTVPALAGREFKGSLVSISPLPDGKSNWYNENIKLYPAVIDIEGATSELRSGMGCQVEIMIKRFTDTLFVPIQAVVKNNGESFVYLEGSDTAVKVETGLDNNIMVRLLKGVREGDRVLLSPPLE